ncbi:MAG: c-type cytochrome [Rhodothalassiaceae bacterium]
MAASLKGFGIALFLLVLCFRPGPAAAQSADTADVDDPAATESDAWQGGDAERGRILFFACKGCHRIGRGAPQEGPSLAHIFGRVAGSDPDYDRYSVALREAGFQWTEARLDAWLRDPDGFLPGNTMRFAGFRRAEDRRDLIAYLRAATGTAK